jgi:LmbE family N-acetylglucosaminyl deacetylase
VVPPVILAISPHLDDAVFSAGAWLSWHTNVHILTVFAGVPDEDFPLTGWDRECGFSSGRQAVRYRQQEDAHACAVIGATWQHLPLVDGQYRNETPYPHELLELTLLTVADELRPDLILAPLGIVHSDHIAVGSSAWHAFKGRPECQLVFYEELPYRVDDPPAAVFEVAAKGLQWFAPEACPDVESAQAAKNRAIASYHSQHWAMPRYVQFVPERLWLCL